MADFPYCPSRVVGCLKLAGVALLLCASGSVSSSPAPQRAADSHYGMALYDYYQGHFFQALTRLNLAKVKGGIAGHGDHPLLVEGGLMLAYGMVREAGKLLQALLKESNIPEQTRNSAWFYLGKVFWLERDLDASSEALARVNAELLEDSDPSLYQEWLYLRGQILLAQPNGPQTAQGLDDILQELPNTSAWAWYLRYNRAVMWLSGANTESAIEELETLASSALPDDDKLPADLAAELTALKQQTQLTLGRLYLGQGSSEQALNALAEIPLDGILSDQALFDYAVAASQQGDHGLALQALDSLQERPLFTPWLQQVPYARAFTIEQMQQPQAALEAYRRAASHYSELDERLATQQSTLSEQRLIEALSFVRAGEAAWQGDAMPYLGEPAILTDAYGRVQVRPQDFSLAQLLAGEAFQLELRNLHDLYRLDDLLDQWRQQLVSFDQMLETRRSRREARIRETRAVLVELNADEWTRQQEKFRRRIERAQAEGDAAFFMSARQRELEQQLAGVEQKLADLPDDQSTRSQRQNYQRMRAYFDWWVADEYGVNRWAAVKQLRELDRVMETFISQRRLMEREMASDARLDEFATRIANQKQELNRVAMMVNRALDQSRQAFLELARAELGRQRSGIASYLKASRHAQARLADQLFLGDTDTVAGPDITEAANDD